MELNNAARRTEDIALDLLKFVAAQTNVGSKGAGSTGFGVIPSSKPEDQVATCSNSMPAAVRWLRPRSKTDEGSAGLASHSGLRLLAREPSGATIFASIASLSRPARRLSLLAVVDRDCAVAAEAAAKFGVARLRDD